MASLYMFTLIAPIVWISVMGFIFQSSLTEIAFHQVRINCPYPLLNKNVTDVTIEANNNISFNVEELDGSSNSYVTVFRCGEGGNVNVNTSFYTYASGIFDAQQAFIGYLSASMSAFFDKVVAYIALIYVYLNAPAEVSGIDFFAYINSALLGLVGLSTYMLIRGISS